MVFRFLDNGKCLDAWRVLGIGLYRKKYKRGDVNKFSHGSMK